MGIVTRINSFVKRFDNAEPNTIEKVGEYDRKDDLTGGNGVDLIECTPFKVNRTVINCRNASKDPQVKDFSQASLFRTAD